jgi:hypothetical protein
MVIVKRKTLLQIVIGLLILWSILLGILYITSGKYFDHAIGILKKQLDKYLKTEIEINREDIHLSLIRNFPFASIELENILVKSAPDFRKEDFPGVFTDTLLFARKVSLIFDLKSLLSKKYQLKKVGIEGAIVQILSDKNGRGNYNIIRTEVDSSQSDSFRFDLKKVSLDNVKLCYRDAKTKFIYVGNISQAECSGSFSSDNFMVNLQAESFDDDLSVHDVSYLYKEEINLNIMLSKRAGNYTLKEGVINAFGIPLQVGGRYSSCDRNYTLNFSGNSLPFQRLKSAMQKQLSDKLILIPQKGDLNIKGNITGRGSGSPVIVMQFKVIDGVLRNNKKDIKVTDFFAQGYYTNGQKLKQSAGFLRIDSLSARSGSSIFFLSGQIQNFNAPIFEMRTRGYIELDKLLFIQELADKYKLAGIVKGNIQARGSLPNSKKFSKADMKKILFQGMLQFDQAYIKPLRNPLPASIISGIIRVKNMQEVELQDISIQTGKSDLKIRGQVTHLPIFSDVQTEFPMFIGKVNAEVFHVEDYLTISSGENGKELKIEFPDSIRVNADIFINSFTFGKFSASDVSGGFLYNPKTIIVRNFSMNTQEGKIQSDIRIQYLDDAIQAESEAYLQHVDLSKLFYAFNEFGQTVITHEYIDGFLSGRVNAKTSWDFSLNPIYKKLELSSQVTIDNGELVNYTPLLGLSDYIEVEELKDIKFDRLQTTVNVVNEKVIIGQMYINSSAISITGSGEHNFDNSYIYRFQVGLSDVLWKKAKKKKPENTEFGYVVDDGLGRHIIPLAITGKDTTFEVIYDKRTAGSMLQDKIIKERQTWKELLSPTNQIPEEKNQDASIDWEDNQKQSKTDSTKTTKKEQDFSIEWEDE